MLEHLGADDSVHRRIGERQMMSVADQADLGARPVIHIWIADAAPWLDEGDDLPRYLEWPPGR